ncbi:universal stress protein [Nitratireductor sp. ZSWI3]|uniref:universal stress protein n=1 Tax=Nitratireductor sp. ZSWI3 TaxID=2966359 RepID=UPI00214FDD0F|nr:universal stress protein [Nitratireductor sp. ZSWI3]MCR4264615.1 universal stress protein [Nitratireductor sp. ZSWI3]
MALRTILSPVGVDQSDQDIKLAVDLCRENDAHLAVFVLSLAAPPPVGEYAAAVSETWAEEREEDIRRLKQRVAEVTDLLAGSDVSAEVDSAYTERAVADNAIGVRARYADLALIGPDLCASDSLKKMVLDGLFFEAQKPALLVPHASMATLAPTTILIAWDSSLEASRAVHEAMPFIAGAGDVHITMVDPRADDVGNGAEPGADLAAYLARQGAKVTIDRLPSSGHAVADVLRVHANDIAADMLIMGAYGHSRLRERIFGGVTVSLTDDPTLPVFIAR